MCAGVPQLVALRQPTGEVHHGLDRHPALYTLTQGIGDMSTVLRSMVIWRKHQQTSLSCLIVIADHSPATDLVAAVQLGVGLLYERHPELAGVGAPRVAVGAVTLGQPAVTRGYL